jgi:predicted N-acyltransferase
MYVCEHTTIHEFTQKQWDDLAVDAGPFLQFHFLAALENSGSINNSHIDNTGWQTCILSVKNEKDELLALVPGYKKTHSYGEYVFDHSWANAYAQHGLNYYPKWISAIPFTPVTSQRILTKLEDLSPIITLIHTYFKQPKTISSCHWLFHTDSLKQHLSNCHSPTRYSVQFQWWNKQYASFDEFLATFKSRKRKDIKKERAKAQQGITIERIVGNSLTDDVRDVFYLCYQQTYLKRSGHHGYLTEAFFKQLFQTMQDNIMVVIAKDEAQILGTSLFLYDKTGLYGRYWGALQDKDCLHFECCYYQGIEFAIEQKLPLFNPGTQGEHKLLRGFEPLICRSSHCMFDMRFHQAVDDFLIREQGAMQAYYESALASLPFNQEAMAECKKGQVG